MSGWAIVAIPAADDAVFKLSSEKVPHITLLYLGDQAGNSKETDIASFVEHVADTSLDRFSLEVDRRGTLGPDDADVLFFKQNRRTQALADIRANLLTNEAINAAYQSTEQYPEWTPHLTMGYPETPAHPDTREYGGIYSVYFDRLAFWTGDSEGYVYTLDPPYDEFSELAMSDKMETFLQNNELQHYGVQGMKWGKRRNPDYTDQQVKRDIQVYGKRGASRVNKSLNAGNSISVARGDEKTRRDRVMGKNKYVRQGGKAAAAVGGVAAANVAISGLRKATYTRTGQQFLNSAFGSGAGVAAMRVADLANSPAARVVVSAGAAKVGSMLAGDAAVGINMRLHGYDPNRR